MKNLIINIHIHEPRPEPGRDWNKLHKQIDWSKEAPDAEQE